MKISMYRPSFLVLCIYILCVMPVMAQDIRYQPECEDEVKKLAEDDSGTKKFVICISVTHSFMNPDQASPIEESVVSFNQEGSQYIHCNPSKTENRGLVLCTIECNKEVDKDAEEKTLVVNLNPAPGPNYKIKTSGKVSPLVESRRKFQFMLLNCEIYTKEPFPKHVFIYYIANKVAKRVNNADRGLQDNY